MTVIRNKGATGAPYTTYIIVVLFIDRNVLLSFKMIIFVTKIRWSLFHLKECAKPAATTWYRQRPQAL